MPYVGITHFTKFEPLANCAIQQLLIYESVQRRVSHGRASHRRGSHRCASHRRGFRRRATYMGATNRKGKHKGVDAMSEQPIDLK